MDINCSFQRLAGEQCSQDKRSRAKEKNALIFTLLSCGKSISAQTHSVGVSDVELEIDLFLARAYFFHILGDPGAVSRVAGIFVGVSLLSTRLTAPGSPRMQFSLHFVIFLA